jgi:hypothetical protein
MSWEIMNYTPHIPDLARSDFNLLEPMEVFLGGQKFQIDDVFKRGVLNWLCFYAADISNMPGRRKKKYVRVKG